MNFLLIGFCKYVVVIVVFLLCAFFSYFSLNICIANACLPPPSSLPFFQSSLSHPYSLSPSLTTYFYRFPSPFASLSTRRFPSDSLYFSIPLVLYPSLSNPLLSVSSTPLSFYLLSSATLRYYIVGVSTPLS